MLFEKIDLLKKGILGILILGVSMIGLSVCNTDGQTFSILPKSADIEDDSVHNTAKVFYEKIEAHQQRMLGAQDEFSRRREANEAFAANQQAGMNDAKAAADSARAANTVAMENVRSRMNEVSPSAQKVADGQQIVAARQAARIAAGR